MDQLPFLLVTQTLTLPPNTHTHTHTRLSTYSFLTHSASRSPHTGRLYLFNLFPIHTNTTSLRAVTAEREEAGDSALAGGGTFVQTKIFLRCEGCRISGGFRDLRFIQSDLGDRARVQRTLIRIRCAIGIWHRHHADGLYGESLVNRRL